MNILQDIDSVMHYENIEKAWKKYKFVFIGFIIALFAGIALFNAYNNNIKTKSQQDFDILFNLTLNKDQNSDYAASIKQNLSKLKTNSAKDLLTLELAKSYKGKDLEEYEKTLTELTSAATQHVKDVALYMLAEHFLNTNVEKAANFTDTYKVTKSDFSYPMIKDIEATALANLGKNQEAKAIYQDLVKSDIPDNLKERISIKLNQIK